MNTENLTGFIETSTPFMTMAKFSEKIEQIVYDKNMDYMEAILYFCTENDLEPEDVVKFVSTNLKSKIELNAIDSGYFPKRSSLPI
jgi:uncharacterized protein YdhG (YjbR/CyaY superfamily)